MPLADHHAETVPGQSAITFRRAGHADCGKTLDLYESLSAESRYHRFHQATPVITASLRRHLTDFDSGPVWLALIGGRCIGEARLSRSAHCNEAHLALAVADELQRTGIGTELVRRLLTASVHESGVLAVSVLPSNFGARRLAARFGLRLILASGVMDAAVARADLDRLLPRH